ncbi:MAG: EAL domain-containing protein [Candidatus Cohnella colombiensis]|uniref:EAL domain-containing protein n=1 Tax=Candidatus Cohnella colombiensis TaxID=3121368 RepID=A0AA95EYU1_9BACL|nr:MAG: EAL domain-containing protein [Cohnella sp.]
MNDWFDVDKWLIWNVTALLLAASAALVTWWLRSRRIQLSFPHQPSYQQEIMDSLYHNSPLIFAIINRKGKFQDINRDPDELIGYSKAELAGKSFFQFLDEQSVEKTRQTFLSTLQGEKLSLEVRVQHKQGQGKDLNITTSPVVRRGKIIGILVFILDISERKRSSERIRHMAYYDDMTGLPNRRFFTKRLQEKLDASRTTKERIAVCYMDLDRFKLINASFGRDFGDIILMQIAERLTRCLPNPGDLARMEGDEFVAVLDHINDDEDVRRRLDEIMAMLEEPFDLNGIPVEITVSIGVALHQGESDEASMLMKRADTALHRMKENGKGDYLLHTSEMDPIALHKLTLQHEMRQALRNNEFILYYQPKYDLGTGKIVGMEALVRWQHPERGIVPPNEFISASEESGMIVELGDWVIQEACRQNKVWQTEGLPCIPVSVNLSIRQFSHRNITNKIAKVLMETGLDPQYLELEITESMTIDFERTMQCLKELTALGVKFSIDDFGTGYSSFHYLKKLPISRLKIDRSFVRDIQQDPNDAAIVAAIIAMAHNLQLQVIAEGVESESQVQFLRKHRCDEMQGFFGSPPVPSSGFQALLQNHHVNAALSV